MIGSLLPQMNEFELCQQVIGGDAKSAEEFDRRYRKPVEDYLISKCSDEASRTAARDITTEVISDCAGPGLLEKFKGEGSLEGWLRQVAFNRLRKHWRKEGKRPDGTSFDELEEARPGRLTSETSDADGEGSGAIDAEFFYKKLMAATVHAFTRLRDDYPDRLAILRLSQLHGVRQRRIAGAFGIHESEISKMRKGGEEFLRSEIATYLHNEFPKGSFTWADLRDFIHDADEVVHDEDLGSKIVGLLGS